MGGEDLTIRHLVMPNHVECCTAPVIAWIAGHMPKVPVNVMDQYDPIVLRPEEPQVPAAVCGARAPLHGTGDLERLPPCP